jgi:hypothetical protein
MGSELAKVVVSPAWERMAKQSNRPGITVTMELDGTQIRLDLRFSDSWPQAIGTKHGNPTMARVRQGLQAYLDANGAQKRLELKQLRQNPPAWAQ